MGTDGTSAVTDPWGQVHDCSGLYVMDAAAFPTSVGVNPSAAITAIAELKIERFIDQHGSPGWTAGDKAPATAWVDAQGRDALDPLNRDGIQDNDEKTCQPLGLIFCEVMHGFLVKIDDHQRPVIDWDNPEAFPRDLSAFTCAEDDGVKEGTTIKVALTADVTDLARLISPDPSLAAVKVGMVEGHSSVTFDDLKATPTLTSAGTPKEPPALRTKGFLRLFVRPSRAPEKPIRFFRYQLDFVDEKGTARQLNGLKLLRNAPGLDLWHETSTLYFEISDQGSRRNRQRGILRISAEDFLRVQVPSLFITGTNDDARKSWALAAFSNYYARELTVVYQTHKEHVMSLITKLVTAIHV
jgi:cholesterol oxidase